MKYLLLKISKKIHRKIGRMYEILSYCMLSPNDIIRLSISFYRENPSLWVTPEHNQRGFQSPLEAEMVETWILKPKRPSKKNRLLNLYSGGGREAILFLNKGFQVHMIEAADNILAYALEQIESAADSMKLKKSLGEVLSYESTELPRGFCIPERKFDVALILFGMYSTIPGRKKRLDFLGDLYGSLAPGGTLLLSLLQSPHIGRGHMGLKKAVSILSLGNRDIEPGDDFRNEFIHYFQDLEDIQSELQNSPFELKALEGTAMAPGVKIFYAVLRKP